jgi:Asp/Glu/hydantoin racemase
MTREIGKALFACFDDSSLLAAREVATSPALGIAGAVLGEIRHSPAKITAAAYADRCCGFFIGTRM